MINNEHKSQIEKFVASFAHYLDVPCSVEVREEDQAGRKAAFVSISTAGDARFLIGRNGQNLQALEHVLRAIVLKENENIQNIVVDINDYKKSKATRVVELAKMAVTKVRNTQKAEVLSPMSSYERRIVHMELASYPDIATESIGEEPQRRIVIKPY
ncbi:MAG: Single-stranded nucleic acid binding R3H domain protein [Candidatus Yanofskybacteria bacterium GW2011_GWA1_44_21]|uniref:Single-stranded nucleic acid binding R3H domain protein n=3 Tax=Parcubacteria group TaxID=1794811 RepID=A0A0G0XJP5_9BACT|nr:MAG: Single-stranded nucleic acid binding R3H domain protein [Candidatus Wolfebacteria bacterium GW2011_GWA2_42_10]KKT50317.1 MAG: Single-stranded nucleic acid binding R3H domain protein [Candidatus Yanofskybacteria bacterium GW2011_GWA1_44_21]KKT90156.1 MAG: Single-stranded nucleic acid binding R3H domain protein [Candidatus Yanofskybacteria bacterium GW2011_GWB1_45_11]OGN03411.1 MAG: hypothetical protein A2657_00550 [Candidatus Yanofskybacteria bacterium RIFCSPHIGHO2_01_FULL_44_110b]OGN150